MDKRLFKVRGDLKEFIRNILAREGIQHRFLQNEEQLYCEVTLSGERFHKIVKRAYCEKLTKETGLLHVTYAESKNDTLCEGLMRLFDTNSFIVVGTKKQ